MVTFKYNIAKCRDNFCIQSIFITLILSFKAQLGNYLTAPLASSGPWTLIRLRRALPPPPCLSPSERPATGSHIALHRHLTVAPTSTPHPAANLSSNLRGALVPRVQRNVVAQIPNSPHPIPWTAAARASGRQIRGLRVLRRRSRGTPAPHQLQSFSSPSSAPPPPPRPYVLLPPPLPLLRVSLALTRDAAVVCRVYGAALL